MLTRRRLSIERAWSDSTWLPVHGCARRPRLAAERGWAARLACAARIVRWASRLSARGLPAPLECEHFFLILVVHVDSGTTSAGVGCGVSGLLFVVRVRARACPSGRSSRCACACLSVRSFRSGFGPLVIERLSVYPRSDTHSSIYIYPLLLVCEGLTSGCVKAGLPKGRDLACLRDACWTTLLRCGVGFAGGAGARCGCLWAGSSSTTTSSWVL